MHSDPVHQPYTPPAAIEGFPPIDVTAEKRATPPKRRTWLIPALGTIAVVLALGVGAGSVLAWQHYETGRAAPVPAPSVTATKPPAKITVRGHVLLIDPDAGWRKGKSCKGKGGYSDIEYGTQVLILSGDGDTVGLGQLDKGETNSASKCLFRFTVEGVKPGEDFYEITTAGRGGYRVSGSQISEFHSLQLGDEDF